MSKNDFLKGTAILTFTMLLSKILGFIYVIPFTNMVGTKGYILFEYAYKPYAIMMSIAIMGLPAAVSKLISKYNALGDYETGRRLFKTGVVILSVFGLFWASLLYLSAPIIAEWFVGKGSTTGNSIEDVTFVIRMVSFALIVVPPMALGRGFFQGYQKMNPTAISQVIEQIVRIIIILAASLMVMKYGSGEMRTAVGWSTFAAFVGAIASVFVLVYYWFKYKKEISVQNHSNTVAKPKMLSIYTELLASSIPFVVVSLAIPLYQNIDIFAINPTLVSTGMTLSQAEYVNSIVALVQKITILPIIFANAFALTLVPAITKSYIEKNKETLHVQITKTFQIIFFVTLPCTIFFMVFGKETFGILLGTKHAIYGGEVTVAYGAIAIFLSFFLVTSAILQGLNKQFFAVLSLCAGLIAKLALSTPFILNFSGSGTAYSSYIGFGISILINMLVIKKYAEYNFRSLVKQSIYVIGLSAVTAIVLSVSKLIMKAYISTSLGDYMYSLTFVAIGGLIGVLIYGGMSYKTGLLGEVLGSKFRKRIK